MAKVTIAGRSFEVAPYSIREMRKAAPFIDRINATAGALSTMEGMVEAAADFCGVLAVGLVKLDPTLTQDEIEGLVGIGDLPELQASFVAVLGDSGLQSQGEALAPPQVADEAAGASLSN